MIHKALLDIQERLRAPKNQVNTFGNYKYRSCEDILEAVKPLLKDNNCVLLINDEVVQVGSRIYVKATASIGVCDGDSMKGISTTAFAREPETKKGMDEAQITGATSSYARKYALNALFAIDDTKDPDATNTHGKDASENTIKDKPKAKPPAKAKPMEYISKEQQSTIMDMVAEAAVGVEKILAFCGCDTFEKIPAAMFDSVMNKLQATIDAKAGMKERQTT